MNMLKFEYAQGLSNPRIWHYLLQLWSVVRTMRLLWVVFSTCIRISGFLCTQLNLSEYNLVSTYYYLQHKRSTIAAVKLGVWSCIMPGLPLHLVQESNACTICIHYLIITSSVVPSIYRRGCLPQSFCVPLVRFVCKGIFFNSIPLSLLTYLVLIWSSQCSQTRSFIYHQEDMFIKVYLFCVKYLSRTLQSLEAVIHHIILYMP